MFGKRRDIEFGSCVKNRHKGNCWRTFCFYVYLKGSQEALRCMLIVSKEEEKGERIEGSREGGREGGGRYSALSTLYDELLFMSPSPLL